MNPPKLYRIVILVDDVDRAHDFYSRLFSMQGERVAPNRHYFDCGGTILACVDPQREGHGSGVIPSKEGRLDYIYFSIDDLDAFHQRVKSLPFDRVDDTIQDRPWGERSFYATDPFGNLICFVQRGTEFLSGFVGE